MNILIIPDFNDIKPAVVMLYSLFLQEQNCIDVYVPVKSIEDERYQRLSAYVESWQGNKLIPIIEDDKIYYDDFFSGSQTDSNYKKGLYCKNQNVNGNRKTEYICSLCKKIDKNTDRILYLDNDIVVKKPLEELYTRDMQGKMLVVCQSISEVINDSYDCNADIQNNYSAEICILGDGSGFDTGIMLINIAELQKLRGFNELCSDNIIYTGWDKYNLIPCQYYMDKSAALRGELKFADRKNIAELRDNGKEGENQYVDITKQLLKETSVIHYSGDSKPWNSKRQQDDIYDCFDNEYEQIEGDALNQYRHITGYKAGESSLPVLIYYGEIFCYNIPNDILIQFGNAFERKGIRVEYYDEQKGDIAGLSKYFGRRFKAVIGVQSYLFSVKLNNSDYIHNNIIGPKFNIILDHPVWHHSKLINVPKDYYVLTHDNNYKLFVDKYYKGVAETFLLPPAANHAITERYIDYDNRSHDVIFIGTYGDYRAKEAMINSCQEDVRAIAWQMVDELLSECSLTYEEAFSYVLKNNGIILNDEEFYDVFSKMTPVFHYVMYYSRYRVIETLLNAGINVEIWGSTWKKSPLESHENLTIHDDITPEESFNIMCDSKISLNIMAWHKGGFTERMANSMGAGTVLVTDETSYNDGAFKDGVNYISYNLIHLEKLPDRIKELLSCDDKRKSIAKSGREYTLKYNTWDERVEDFLKLYE